jgi:hypothetical protein
MRVPVVYRDATGVIAGELETDGRDLRMTLDGLTFEGRDLDMLEPAEGVPLPARFTLGDDLCACQLRFALPISVMAGADELAASLGVELELGAPRLLPRGGIDREVLRLELVVGDRRVRSSGTTGWFEDELVELARACPDLHFKTCFGCGLSDYSPAGHGLFGGLMCFRDNKAAYRAVTTKCELFAIHDTFTEHVQETHVCPEWEARRPGSGYRG